MASRLPAPANGGREKIIVAVHGIGDQTRCETIQQVTRQFCRFYRLPDTIPLGHLFSQIVDSGSPARPAGGVFRHDALPGLGFSEVYWSGVPRVVERKNYTLEDAKQWARTIVGRVAQRNAARSGSQDIDGPPPNVELAEQVIGELIDAVDTIEKLCFLASSARLFQFGLKQVLMDYLGDVQVVTEFAAYRQRILEMYHQTMSQVRASNNGADIYIIAHSEGTVISLLALLQALQYAGSGLAGHECYQWAGQVRGLMTIGSPLDTHMMLWPELWAGLKPQAPKPPAGAIDWRNYFDYGDPIGERLGRTRKWLAGTGWRGYFAFSDDHDVGFARYLFPGKAHCDYWTDAAVFDHFIESVVHLEEGMGDGGWGVGTEATTEETIARGGSRGFDGQEAEGGVGAIVMAEAAMTAAQIEAPEERGVIPLADAPRPRSRFVPELLSPMLPFLSAALLLVSAVFLFYKGAAALALPFCETAGDVLRNVAAVSLLLGGATAITRVPRLTAHWTWRAGALFGFIASLACVPLILSPGAKDCLGVMLDPLHSIPGGPAVLDCLGHWARAISTAAPNFALQGTTLGVIVFTTIGVMIVGLIGCMRPKWGARPLAVMGACAVAGLFLARLGGERLYDRFDRTRQMLEADPQAEAQATIDAVAIHLVNAYASDPRAKRPPYDEFVADRIRRWHAHHTIEDSPVAVTHPVPRSPATTAGGAALLAAAAGSRVGPATAGPTNPATQPGSTLEIWPLFLTCSAFLYLWYCAMLIFDLSVVWHHYVRQSAILEDLDQMREAEITDAAAEEIDRLLVQSEQDAA